MSLHESSGGMWGSTKCQGFESELFCHLVRSKQTVKSHVHGSCHVQQSLFAQPYKVIKS